MGVKFKSDKTQPTVQISQSRFMGTTNPLKKQTFDNQFDGTLKDSCSITTIIRVLRSQTEVGLWKRKYTHHFYSYVYPNVNCLKYTQCVQEKQFKLYASNCVMQHVSGLFDNPRRLTTQAGIHPFTIAGGFFIKFQAAQQKLIQTHSHTKRIAIRSTFGVQYFAQWHLHMKAGVGDENNDLFIERWPAEPPELQPIQYRSILYIHS